MDFLISPAYSVPPIKTTRSLNETTINVPEFVPSSSGSANNVGADKTVNPGSCSANSSLVGVMNNWRAKRLCHAYSFTTSTGRRYFVSAPAKPLKENTSFLSFKWFTTFSNNLLNEASSIGLFTAPQSTIDSDTSSRTMKRSSGERPVYLPVVACTAPVDVKTPSLRDKIFSTNPGTDKFLCTLSLDKIS